MLRRKPNVCVYNKYKTSPSPVCAQVEVQHEGKTHTLEVPEGESILNVALDKKIDLPHDCKLGVCMTCPAKLLSGKVEASGSMLSDDVAEKGYTLLCVATPKSDCKITTISEVRACAQPARGEAARGRVPMRFARKQ